VFRYASPREAIDSLRALALERDEVLRRDEQRIGADASKNGGRLDQGALAQLELAKDASASYRRIADLYEPLVPYMTPTDASDLGKIVAGSARNGGQLDAGALGQLKAVVFVRAGKMTPAMGELYSAGSRLIGEVQLILARDAARIVAAAAKNGGQPDAAALKEINTAMKMLADLGEGLNTLAKHPGAVSDQQLTAIAAELNGISTRLHHPVAA
jgi:hypothetical protein